MMLSLIKSYDEEIISLEEAKNYLRIEHDVEDKFISGLIKSTREAIEAIIQKSIVLQKWKYEIDSSSMCYLDSGDSGLPCFFCGSVNIALPKPPVINIESVSINNVKLGANAYKLEKMSNKYCLYVNYTNERLLDKNMSVSVIYNAGMAENSENIPYQLKLANLMLLSNAYQERFAYNSANIISSGIKQLLSPFLNMRIS